MIRFKISLLLLPLLVFVLLSGCENRVGVTTSYPRPGNYPLVKVSALKDSVFVPGSYNVQAYVVGTIICPPGAMCILPNSIIISDFPKTDSTSFQPLLTMSNPDVFIPKVRYLISIKVVEPGTIDQKTGKKVRHFELLGFAEMK